MRNKFIFVTVCVFTLLIASSSFLGLNASQGLEDAKIQELEIQVTNLETELNELKATPKGSLDNRVAALENKTQYIQLNRANDGATRFSGRESSCGFIIHGNGQFNTYCP